ncbi:hypothetical protein SAMN05216374_0993 [Tardiphaga sp. OK246]|uniref:hypothetical protein n=1 Tax=Tardiphaga sp. OK246 TaxID=1855307 RepID=UPI000B70693D|nr:hypothetical protein [Tardiphaga sp. OK246]SNS36569.1 hypothetical protein SAMN05216374_0993 [Tardiphaga sp. OK246]
MAQTPSITTISNSPPVDHEVARVITALRSSMRDGNCLTEPLSLTTRGRLSHRLALLQACTEQASGDQIRLEIAKLMASYPSLRGASANDAAAMVFQYSEALAGVPLWAVRDACGAIARGSVKDVNPDFAPTSARLRQIVDGITTAAHLEAKQIGVILEAPVVLPDDDEKAEAVRKGVGDAMRARANEMREADEALRRPVLVPEGGGFKAPSPKDLSEIYKTRRLPGLPVRNVTRNDDRNGHATVDEEYADHLRDAVGQ